jgi:hypothetical protein
MTSTREDYGVRKPPSLKVASESYREEICEVARLHDTAAAKPSMKAPPSANVVSPWHAKTTLLDRPFTVRPRT